MIAQPMRFAALALLSTAALPLLTTLPAAAVTVSVGGTLYDVTTLTTSYQGSPGDFESLLAGGRMPWWKDDALAAEFAMKTFNALGAGSDPSYGPIFAYGADPTAGKVSGVYQLLADINMQDVVFPPPATTDTLKYAIATAPVPLPLPLFGAAAGFGWSRRLRKRIRSRNVSTEG